MKSLASKSAKNLANKNVKLLVKNLVLKNAKLLAKKHKTAKLKPNALTTTKVANINTEQKNKFRIA